MTKPVQVTNISWHHGMGAVYSIWLYHPYPLGPSVFLLHTPSTGAITLFIKAPSQSHD